MMDIYRDSSLTQEKFEILSLNACDNFYFEVIADLSVSHRFNTENYFLLKLLKGKWLIHQPTRCPSPSVSPAAPISYISIVRLSVSECPYHSVTCTELFRLLHGNICVSARSLPCSLSAARGSHTLEAYRPTECEMSSNLSLLCHGELARVSIFVKNQEHRQ